MLRSLTIWIIVFHCLFLSSTTQAKTKCEHDCPKNDKYASDNGNNIRGGGKSVDNSAAAHYTNPIGDDFSNAYTSGSDTATDMIDGVNAVWTDVIDGFDTIGDSLTNVGNDIANAATDAADSIGNAADDLANSISSSFCSIFRC